MIQKSRNTAISLLIFSILFSGCGFEQLSRLVIIHVTLIDGTGLAPQPDMAIVVSKNLIEKIGKTDSIEIPENARIIDATGKFAIPGLWDMHVHLSQTKEDVLPLLVANGITSVRNMGGDIDEHKTMKQMIKIGELIGPRIKTPGPILESPAAIDRLKKQGVQERYWLTRAPVPNPESAEAVVDSVLALGVDFLKIRESSSIEGYIAVAEAAQKRGVMLAGHPPYALDPVEGAALNLASFEHASYPYPLDEDEKARDRVLRAFVEHSVTIVPTIVAWQTHIMFPDTLRALLQDSLGLREPRRRLLSNYLVREWQEDLDAMPSKDLNWMRGYNGFISRMCNDLQVMHQAGIPIMPGSDLCGVGLFPGYSLHQELENMVRYLGMSPMAVIESATRIPAEFFKLADSLGTLAPGKIADMVLLDASPLLDITNTRHIYAVINNGEYFDLQAIQKLLKGLSPTTQGNFTLISLELMP